jgi:hypothetical protein
MNAGNYRLVIEPERKKDERNRHGWIVVQLLLLFPAAVMLALLLVALVRGA